jgi:hypothetical protein
MKNNARREQITDPSWKDQYAWCLEHLALALVIPSQSQLEELAEADCHEHGDYARDNGAGEFQIGILAHGRACHLPPLTLRGNHVEVGPAQPARHCECHVLQCFVHVRIFLAGIRQPLGSSCHTHRHTAHDWLRHVDSRGSHQYYRLSTHFEKGWMHVFGGVCDSCCPEVVDAIKRSYASLCTAYISCGICVHSTKG